MMQDVKESLLGRLFAYGALARSGRLVEDWQSDKDSQIIKEFTNALISLAAKKRYLHEPVVHVLLDFIEKPPVEAVVTHVMEAPELHKWFEQAIEVGNPDALLLALKLREKISVDHPVFNKLLPVSCVEALSRSAFASNVPLLIFWKVMVKMWLTVKKKKNQKHGPRGHIAFSLATFFSSFALVH
ncbi:DNA polymerase V protein [Raphanus sativus]|nr:DNA polymerase V protein [Raphanus sativus]